MAGKNAWRIVPGTWVILKVGYLGKWGRVLRADPNDCFVLETDGSKEVWAVRDDFRVKQDRQEPHDWFPMRKTLPYGRYLEADGSSVLHNRDYEPLMRIRSDGRRELCDRSERIKFDRQEWFYGNSVRQPWQSAETFQKCISLLVGE